MLIKRKLKDLPRGKKPRFYAKHGAGKERKKPRLFGRKEGQRSTEIAERERVSLIKMQRGQKIINGEKNHE